MRFLLCVAFFPLGFVSALAFQTCRDIPNSADVNTFLKTQFHYIVVGGGTAGVTLAARLSENPAVNVGVLEAGDFYGDDPVINTPNLYSLALGNPKYDWNFASTPQANAGLRNISISRGKMLGGSSGINLMAFNRASAKEYDSWDQFAPSSGWNWDGLLPYFKKSEHVALSPQDPFPLYSRSPPASPQSLALYDGFIGPLQVSHNDFYFDSVPKFVQTMNAMSVGTNPNPHSGDATGVYNTLLSVYRKEGTRSYSPIAYFCNQPAYPNLRILLNAQAIKVEFSGTNQPIVASGVQFSFNSSVFTVNASKEVILSSGTVKTPQLLELSGIGNSSILSEFGVPTLVNLPGVGENLQEHVFAPIQWKLKPGEESFDILRNNATVAQQEQIRYNLNRTGLLAALDSPLAFVSLQTMTQNTSFSRLLQIFDEEAAVVGKSTFTAMQYEIQRSWIQAGIPQSELIFWSRGIINPVPNEYYIVALGGLSHPTSRGDIHIVSVDSTVQPAINVGFLSTKFDEQVILEALKFLLRAGTTSPLSDIISSQTSPDPATQSDEDLLNYIRFTLSGIGHLIGTAAMAPQHSGGVVDDSLRVYGTRNLRVIDASIIPVHIAAHTQATVYAIAEKAATMILTGH